MGLDNIPKTLPCKLANTAVVAEEGYVDCVETRKCGGCIWSKVKDSSPLVKDIDGALGMFGAGCWYRGKSGNWMLNSFDEFMEGSPSDYEKFPFDFYGDYLNKFDIDDGEGLEPDDCKRLAKWMSDYTEAFAMFTEIRYRDEEVSSEEKERMIKEDVDQWIYASWWLKFVAEYADGFIVWY